MKSYVISIAVDVPDAAKVIAAANQYLDDCGCAPEIIDIGAALLLLIETDLPPLDCGFEITNTATEQGSF